MPVLPLVASTIVVRPGSMRPSSSAAWIIATPMRSFTDPPGLNISSLPNTRASGASRVRCTIGVRPTWSAMLIGMAPIGLVWQRPLIGVDAPALAQAHALVQAQGVRVVGGDAELGEPEAGPRRLREHAAQERLAQSAAPGPGVDGEQVDVDGVVRPAARQRKPLHGAVGLRDAAQVAVDARGAQVRLGEVLERLRLVVG